MAEEVNQNTQVVQEQDSSQGNQSNQQSAPQIDYDKIAEIVKSGTSQKESAILKSYFSQQGLSADEMTAAISAYKEQKAANTPDVTAMQSQLEQAQNAALQSEIQRMGTLEAIALGIDVKTVPYVLKLADMSAVADKDGNVNQEALKKAVSKVLEDVPQFRPLANAGNGFKLGADGSQEQQKATDDALKAAFGI